MILGDDGHVEILPHPRTERDDRITDRNPALRERTGGHTRPRHAAEPGRRPNAPIGDILQPRPCLQQQALLDATQPNGLRYYWKSDFLPRVESGLVEVCTAALDLMPSPHSATCSSRSTVPSTPSAKITRPSATATPRA